LKAAVYYNHKDIRIEELEKPEILGNEVLIRVKTCGICGSDVHLLEGKWAVEDERVIMGHEFAGIVEKTGENVSDLKTGDRVAVDPNIVCGSCYYCRMDTRNYYCTNRKVIGWAGWLNGGFSELVKAPEKVVYGLPDTVSFEEAAMVEPLACALRGIDNTRIKSGDRVVILGAGSMGLLLLQLVLMAGASLVLVTDVQDIRLERAAELGADLTVNSVKDDVEKVVLDATDGIGADVVIEAAGTSETASQAVSLIRRGGKVCLFGVAPQEEFIRIKPFELYYKEAVLVSSFCNPFTFQRAIELLRNNKINVTGLITHRYPLADINSAFKTMLEDDRRCKVMIEV
jgi:2-desacetyl-2-hydroxyethyl bacteriochlorophyllide A dehydrogenase